ncbi:hypothetical protein QAD02_007727 [Eretmocerus hayati]|uniref:Uncharacterized protein n=1 Tax=Eretmocerus hayati TaxID=131215 RepID=A0ACC2N4G3_9HYME|nr:hypothetical protein QAD02_007727 [Eretmocerus hayati]
MLAPEQRKIPAFSAAFARVFVCRGRLACSIKSKFASAGLSDAYTILEKNGIDSIDTLEDLIQLTPEKFEEWFPIFGIQLKIKRLCRAGVDELKSKPSNNHTATTSSVPEITAGPAPQQAQESQSNGGIVIVRIENDQGVLPISPQNRDPGDPKRNKYRSNKPEVANFDLGALLESSASGQALIKIYKHKHKFNTRQQSKLCGLIVDYFLNTLKDQLLNNQDLQYIAWLITVKFKNEIISDYYVDPLSANKSRSNKAKLSRGRLTHRYRNEWGIVREANKLDKTSNVNLEPQCTDKSSTNDYDGHEAKVILQCGDNDDDEKETTTLWETALGVRIEEIHKPLRRTLLLVLTDWPSLKLDYFQKLVSLKYH